jgi:hypothetical protein
MVFYTNPIPCIVFALIIGLHVLSSLSRERSALIFNIVNICLHGALAAAELCLGSTLGEITLLYAVSFLIYLILSSLLTLKKDDGDERGETHDI